MSKLVLIVDCVSISLSNKLGYLSSLQNQKHFPTKPKNAVNLYFIYFISFHFILFPLCVFIVSSF